MLLEPAPNPAPGITSQPAGGASEANNADEDCAKGSGDATSVKGSHPGSGGHGKEAAVSVKMSLPRPGDVCDHCDQPRDDADREGAKSADANCAVSSQPVEGGSNAVAEDCGQARGARGIKDAGSEKERCDTRSANSAAEGGGPTNGWGGIKAAKSR